MNNKIPQMNDSLRERMYQKVEKMYVSNFSQENYWEILLKKSKIILQFNKLTLMKKSLLASVVTTSLILSVMYVSTFFTLASHNNNLTVEALINKAQAAAEKNAMEGRFLHQKIKFIASINNPKATHSPPGGILMIHSLPEDIIETWADTVSGNYMFVNSDTSPNEKVYFVDITKNGKRKVYTENNSYDQPIRKGLSDNAFFNFNKILGSGLRSVLNGKAKVESLKSIFDFSLKVTDVSYLGQSNLHGKTVEGLSFNTQEIHHPEEKNLINFYFDATTFNLVEARIVNLQDGSISQVKFLKNEYTDQEPTVTIDNTVLTLGNSST